MLFESLWIHKSRRRKQLKSSYYEGALDLLIEAQHSATEEGRCLLNPGTVAFIILILAKLQPMKMPKWLIKLIKAALPLKQLKY